MRSHKQGADGFWTAKTWQDKEKQEEEDELHDIEEGLHPHQAASQPLNMTTLTSSQVDQTCTSDHIPLYITKLQPLYITKLQAQVSFMLE